MSSETFDLMGYMNLIPYVPVEMNVEYDVGQNGGQFMIIVGSDDMERAMEMS